MDVNPEITRPVVRYMGAKFRLAPWILSFFPEHRTYVEPYAGGASILLRKPRSYAEVYNDLDGEIVNVFRVLRDPDQAKRLIDLLALTPFARDEFLLCYEVTEDPVERARRMIARSFMGHGATAVALRRRTGFRADSNRSGTTPSQDWANLPDALYAIVERLRGVVIEQRPAIGIIKRFDKPDTLHYIDPPYVHETRSKKRVKGALEHAYAHEMSFTQHRTLLRTVKRCTGMVVLSGYRTDLYDKELKTWSRFDKDTFADGARPRVESLWLNPNAMARFTLPLFEAAGK